MDATLKAKHDDIRRVLADLDALDDAARAAAASFRAEMNGQRSRNEWSADIAGRWITILVQARKEHRARLDAVVTPIIEIPEGRYAIKGEDGTWDFYLVDTYRSGRTRVRQQVSDELLSIAWAVREAALRKIKEMGPLESAIAYGRELGVCAKCGKTLTNPSSIAAGIGPVCANRY